MWKLAALVVIISAVSAQQRRMLVGGVEDVGENDELAKQALNYAMKEYNKASNDAFASKMIKINTMQKQLVSGVLYMMDVDIARTMCRKQLVDVGNCGLHSDQDLAKVVNCKFTVLSVPWKLEFNMSSNQCVLRSPTKE
ncbi:cystatin-like [Pelodytes ibericus]